MAEKRKERPLAFQSVADIDALATSKADAEMIRRDAKRGREGDLLPRRPIRDAFAFRFGFSAGAVRDWGHASKAPEAAARILLTLTARAGGGRASARRGATKDATFSA